MFYMLIIKGHVFIAKRVLYFPSLAMFLSIPNSHESVVAESTTHNSGVTILINKHEMS